MLGNLRKLNGFVEGIFERKRREKDGFLLGIYWRSIGESEGRGGLKEKRILGF